MNTFHDVIKKEALKWARKNAVAMPGEIVETVWGDWKKPHKVVIYSVGCCLCTGNLDKKNREFKAELQMTYYGLKIPVSGIIPTENPGYGLALQNFIKADGTVWEEKREGINNSTVHWKLPESWPYTEVNDDPGL
jgi:hypothetical protein